MRLPPLHDGIIRSRYKRFLADVTLADGREVVAHVPNTGAMTGCWAPGAPVQLSHSDNPARKLAWTLERVDMGAGWVGVNTARVNGVIAEAVAAGTITELSGYARVEREPAFLADGFPRSRFDLRGIAPDGRPDALIEVKNTTLLVDDSVQFPDAVTVRGRKHLDLLAIAAARGLRAVIVFAINRPEGRWFAPAVEVDPAYAQCLAEVVDRGVEAVAVRLRHTGDGIEVAGSAAWRGY
jgi:sugar fermentation stimulation protein A